MLNFVFFLINTELCVQHPAGAWWGLGVDCSIRQPYLTINTESELGLDLEVHSLS